MSRSPAQVHLKWLLKEKVEQEEAERLALNIRNWIVEEALNLVLRCDEDEADCLDCINVVRSFSFSDVRDGKRSRTLD